MRDEVIVAQPRGLPQNRAIPVKELRTFPQQLASGTTGGAAMHKVLVIGYGNPTRVDDGVGYHVAEEFKNTTYDRDLVDVIATRELMPSVIQPASRGGLVIFINVTTMGKPGTVREQEVSPEEHLDGILNCELTPASLLSACQVVYKRCPAAVLLSITGEDFGFGGQLSPKVQAALPKIVDRINHLIAATRQRDVQGPMLQEKIAV
jgi:hydrogenase maturation protease